MAYLHCTGTGQGHVQETGLTMGPSSSPCPRPFLCNILGPIASGAVPCTCVGAIAVQCK